MAGKIEGATGKGYGMHGPQKHVIPTFMWKEYAEPMGGSNETAGTEGYMLKQALDKSKSIGLKGK